MDKRTARRLCQLNTDFYRRQCDSFSATRQSPWAGWRRVAELFEEDGAAQRLSILDVACGNLRFQTFLAQRFPDAQLACYCVDGCEDLLPQPVPFFVEFRQMDVVEALLGCLPDDGEGRDAEAADAAVPNDADRALRLSESFGPAGLDAAVSFGFMHHVPTERLRGVLLEALLASVRPGGLVAVSFWRFMDDPAFQRKVPAAHAEALAYTGIDGGTLEEGDWLLGWKNAAGAYRYCHSFSNRELADMIDCVADRADLLARFSADGKSGALNEYLVFRKC